jgi:hypothetical protein
LRAWFEVTYFLRLETIWWWLITPLSPSPYIFKQGGCVSHSRKWHNDYMYIENKDLWRIEPIALWGSHARIERNFHKHVEIQWICIYINVLQQGRIRQLQVPFYIQQCN